MGERKDGIPPTKPTGRLFGSVSQGKSVKTRSKNQLTGELHSLTKGKPGPKQIMKNGVRRRAFIKGLGLTGAALLPGTALLTNNAKAGDDGGGQISKGDAS